MPYRRKLSGFGGFARDRYFFVTNTCHPLLRTSGVFCSYLPDFFQNTGVRNGVLCLIFVKKQGRRGIAPKIRIELFTYYNTLMKFFLLSFSVMVEKEKWCIICWSAWFLILSAFYFLYRKESIYLNDARMNIKFPLNDALECFFSDFKLIWIKVQPV